MSNYLSTSQRRWARLPSACLLLVAAACQRAPDVERTPPATPAPPPPAPEIACTLIGCEDQLIVEVAPRPKGAFRVTATDAADSVQRARCDSVTACSAGPDTADSVAVVRFEPTTGAVRIRITDGAGRSTELQSVPTYEGVYPNGRQCGAACRVARVRVRWPH